MKYRLSGLYFAILTEKNGFRLAFWAPEPYNQICRSVPMLEMISRRCLNPKIEEKINAAGMILLLIVMALILSNDIWNVISGAYKEILGG